jgi:hypothetical protein
LMSVKTKFSPTLPAKKTGSESAADRSLYFAVTVAAVAALIAVAGALLPVVRGGSRGITVLVPVILAILPLALVLWFARRKQVLATAGVLVGLAVLSPGRILLDLQFAVDPSSTSRPELYLPSSLDRPDPGFGLWLLLIAQCVMMISGLLALRVARRDADFSRVDSSSLGSDMVPGEPSEPMKTRPAKAPPMKAPAMKALDARRWVLPIVLVTVIMAVGLLLAPFSSRDVYLLALPAIQAPALVLSGSLLLACTLVLVAVLALSTGEDFARGCLLGLGIGVGVIVLPNVISGWAITDLSPSAGPIIALVSVLLLGLIAFAQAKNPMANPADHKTANDKPVVKKRTSVSKQAQNRASRGSVQNKGARRNAVIALPATARGEIITGIFGWIAALACLGGVFLPQVTVVSGNAGVYSPDRWWLLSSGILLALASSGLFFSRVAVRVRPVLSVVWVGVVLTGAAVLDLAVVSAQAGGVFSSGSGVIWTALAMFFAVVAACSSVVTGMFEREDSVDDQSGEYRARPAVVAVLALAALGVIAGCGLSAISAPDYAGSSLFTTFTTSSWGLVIALLTILGALVLATRCQPSRAVALLGGCVMVMALRLMELPLLSGEVSGVHGDTGWWISLGSLVLLLAALVMEAFEIGRHKQRFAD